MIRILAIATALGLIAVSFGSVTAQNLSADPSVDITEAFIADYNSRNP